MDAGGGYQRNVLGGRLTECCTRPVTGFYRTGSCETGPEDRGLHVVCAQMTGAAPATKPPVGLSAHVVALVLSPVATELPETVNALIWVRQGKERLALANISGAMMIQATIPSSLALFATPWLFDTPLIVAGVLTAIAIVYLWWLFRRGRVDARWLLPVGALYGVFGAFATWYFLR